MIQQIYFHPKYAPLILNGTKIRTVRWSAGREDERFIVGPATLVIESEPDEVCLPARVTAVRATIVSDLTDDDAIADGFQNATDLREALAFHYPELGLADSVGLLNDQGTSDYAA